MTYLSIKNWAADDRPRERLLQKGVKSLSDAELIAILLGSGSRELSAVDLARKVLRMADNNLSALAKKSLTDLVSLHGIGEAKAVTIIAAMELGRRSKTAELGEKPQLLSSAEVFHLIRSELGDLQHEEFWVLFLNRSNRLIEKFKLSQGGVAGTVIDVRLILKRGIELLASSLIICHNHPSGNLSPSDNDKAITHKIKSAAGQMDIRLLDHIIVCDNSYFSFTDEGIL